MEKEELKSQLLAEKQRLEQQLEMLRANASAIQGALNTIDWTLKKMDEEPKPEEKKSEEAKPATPEPKSKKI